MVLAPIVLFTYDRLEHTRRTVDALLANELAEESNLIIYSDGPRKPEVIARVTEVRAYLQTIRGFKSVQIRERERNFGLGKNISEGVTEVLNEHGRAIILEDDLTTSKWFLRFMNDALNKYENYDEVISIVGYFYPVNAKLPSSFFLKGSDCLGWATWKRGWDLFDQDASRLLKKLEAMNGQAEFDHQGNYPYTQMLRNQLEGKVDSWAIRWYASAFVNGKLSLYPGKSLVYHAGNDGTGTNYTTDDFLDVELSEDPVPVEDIPVTDSQISRHALVNYFRTTRRKNLIRRAINKAIKLFRFENHVGKRTMLQLKNKVKKRLSMPGWYGDFASWREATSQSTGYDSKTIVEKVKNALILVKNGQAAFERDSVTFSKFEYSWPVLSALLWMAAQKKGKLSVLDFGGSLGSTWFQYRKFLSPLDVNWNIVEQGIFVDYGRRYFEDQNLRFFYTVEDSVIANSPDVVLLSSVLPYLEHPYEMLKRIMDLRAPYIIIDKMPFIVGRQTDLLTVQRVPPSIYDASYPAWFFNEETFIRFVASQYEVTEEFLNDDKANIPSVFKGFLLKLKEA